MTDFFERQEFHDLVEHLHGQLREHDGPGHAHVVRRRNGGHVGGHVALVGGPGRDPAAAALGGRHQEQVLVPPVVLLAQDHAAGRGGRAAVVGVRVLDDGRCGVEQVRDGGWRQSGLAAKWWLLVTLFALRALLALGPGVGAHLATLLRVRLHGRDNTKPGRINAFRKEAIKRERERERSLKWGIKEIRREMLLKSIIPFQCSMEGQPETEPAKPGEEIETG